MDPIEQSFDELGASRNEKISKWIGAIARIPSSNISAATFASTIEHMVKNADSLNIVEHDDDYCRFASGFAVDLGWYEDGNGVRPDNDCFAIIYFPYGGEDEIIFGFGPDNKADVGDQNFKFKEFMKKNGAKSGQKFDWQGAYDMLCKMIRYESESIPDYQKE